MNNPHRKEDLRLTAEAIHNQALSAAFLGHSIEANTGDVFQYSSVGGDHLWDVYTLFVLEYIETVAKISRFDEAELKVAVAKFQDKTA